MELFTSEGAPGAGGLVTHHNLPLQVEQERDELYGKFTAAILEVQQKAGFRNLVLERKLQALSTAVEKKEVQFNEALAASNLDPAALTLVSCRLEVSPGRVLGPGWAGRLLLPHLVAVTHLLAKSCACPASHSTGDIG